VCATLKLKRRRLLPSRLPTCDEDDEDATHLFLCEVEFGQGRGLDVVG
jgi:hypothetical protein